MRWRWWYAISPLAMFMWATYEYTGARKTLILALLRHADKP